MQDNGRLSIFQCGHLQPDDLTLYQLLCFSRAILDDDKSSGASIVFHFCFATAAMITKECAKRSGFEFGVD